MIKTLDEGLVSHLAAGEVIDRPSSVIRECIDNSIDAGSTKVAIECIDGGKSSIVIDDDGSGIDKEDLRTIASPHATSKISVLDDIYNISTLGFRGEALFSLVSVGDLSIESNRHSVSFVNMKRSDVLRSVKEKGTRITLKGIFASLPARLSFLSSASTESTRCKTLIEEKALPFPNVEFIYSNDGRELLHYYRETEIERVSHFLQSTISSKVEYVSTKDEDFSIKLYYSPSLIRRDKKKIKIYVNKRAVQDAYLMSALLHAFSRTLPGGMFPSAVVFIENSNELTDFNVHPQKKECRLRNAHNIHHALATIFNDFFIEEEKNIVSNPPIDNVKNDIVKPDEGYTTEDFGPTQYSEPLSRPSFPTYEHHEVTRENVKEQLSYETKVNTPLNQPYDKSAPSNKLFEETNEIPFTYIGQLWNEFLLYTIEEKFYIIDQHAAAERVMFDKLRKNVNVQELLFPITLELESDISEALDKNKDAFISKGIGLTKKEKGLWTVTSLPSCCKNSEREILSLIENATDTDLDQKIYAIIACHNSVRAGMYLSEKDAISLIKDTLALDERVCPHGRVFTLKITKEELEKLVLR